MEKLLASDILVILIQSITAIIVAFIAAWAAGRKKKSSEESKGEDQKSEAYKSSPDTSPTQRDWILRVIVGGVVGAVTFSLIGFTYNSLLPDPTVEITSPRPSEQVIVRIIERGGGIFSIKGNSTRVASDTNLGVFILVHPDEPFAEGWWVQSSVIMQTDGEWSGLAQIGDSRNPPNVGDRLFIVAIVTERNQTKAGDHVDDPKDLLPKAQSEVISLEIGSIE